MTTSAPTDPTALTDPTVTTDPTPPVLSPKEQILADIDEWQRRHDASDQAQTGLKAVQTQATQDVAIAQSSVDDANAKLNSAQVNFATVKANSDAAVAAAQLKADQAHQAILDELATIKADADKLD